MRGPSGRRPAMWAVDTSPSFRPLEPRAFVTREVIDHCGMAVKMAVRLTHGARRSWGAMALREAHMQSRRATGAQGLGAGIWAE
jgi:hypothetical protein